MAQPLLSPDWYRVARLKPRLRVAVRVRRQTLRGSRWYLLCDDTTGRQHLINEAAYGFIGRCDGTHDVQTVWDAMLAGDAESAPTQSEILELLVQLDELDLLQCERTPDTDVLFRRHDQRRRQRRRSMINPFSFRLSFGDPSRWLPRLDPIAHALFRPAVFWLWLTAVALAGCAAAANWDGLAAHGRELLGSPRALWLAWLCFPVMKALHELGHALAVRRWGGDVREFGLGLMLLVPAPYVDASAASAFERRGQRAGVAAAGIVVELALFALAMLVWVGAQPGAVRDLALVVIVIGGVSTLAFNGKLIEDLLNYSRFVSEKPQSDEVHLSDLIERILGDRSLAVGEQGVQVDVQVPRIVLRTWERGLHQALSNLIDNALKYSRHAKPPRLRVEAQPLGDGCRISVTDNGIGFDMKYHDRIFGLFNRLVRASEFEGTGAGLAIVAKLVEKLGGSVRAESVLGKGAMFSIELPHLQPQNPCAQ